MKGTNSERRPIGHIAVKRLSAVEISRDASNQHELNAGAIRSALGLPEGRTKGGLTLHLRPGSDDTETVDVRYTLYDSRADKPRAAEYRMYYTGQGWGTFSQQGDLLVLWRPDDTLQLEGIIAPSGSRVESELLQILDLRGAELPTQGFIIPAVERAEPSQASAVLEAMHAETHVTTETVRGHPVFRRAVQDGRFPSTADMSAAGRELVGMGLAGLDDDAAITASLDAETALFNAMQEALDGRRLSRLQESAKLSLQEVLGFASSILNKQKSRRGSSLQHHVQFILDRHHIPYTPQCVTEGGERPDFVVPSRSAYLDVAFPAERLRMIACKSTLKERWRQILNEAARIPEKHVVTLERRLTRPLASAMKAAHLHVFVPLAVRDQYDEPWVGTEVGTIVDLVAEIRSAGETSSSVQSSEPRVASRNSLSRGTSWPV